MSRWIGTPRANEMNPKYCRGITWTQGSTKTGSGKTGKTQSMAKRSRTVAGHRALTAGCATNLGCRFRFQCCDRIDVSGSKRQPPARETAPVVQKLRLRYAKRGRLRFSSHRDFQRALERALRRANLPMGYSAGFSPHPKISYANAAPTGVASEAEYVEIGVVSECDPELVRQALDRVLPPGLDVVDLVVARSTDFVARLEASHWQIELPGVSAPQALTAVEIGRAHV